MDGYAVARAFRADPAQSGAALIALSGYGREEDRRRAREAGFDHHLTKPVDPQGLNRLLADRKSVVEGKRGSFGGGPVIKKKKKKDVLIERSTQVPDLLVFDLNATHLDIVDCI